MTVGVGGRGVGVAVGGIAVAVASGVGVAVGGTAVGVASAVGAVVAGSGPGLDVRVGVKVGRSATPCLVEQADSETTIITDEKSNSTLFLIVISITP